MAEVELVAITRSGGADCSNSDGAPAAGAVILSSEGRPDVLTVWCASCLAGFDLPAVERHLNGSRLRAVSGVAS